MVEKRKLIMKNQLFVTNKYTGKHHRNQAKTLEPASYDTSNVTRYRTLMMNISKYYCKSTTIILFSVSSHLRSKSPPLPFFP